MLPLLIERILCKNKNEPLLYLGLRWLSEMCACGHTSVVYGAGNHRHGFPLTLRPETKVHLTQTCFNLTRLLSLDTVTLSYRLAVTSELTLRVHVIELFL